MSPLTLYWKVLSWHPCKALLSFLTSVCPCQFTHPHFLFVFSLLFCFPKLLQVVFLFAINNKCFWISLPTPFIKTMSYSYSYGTLSSRNYCKSNFLLYQYYLALGNNNTKKLHTMSKVWNPLKILIHPYILSTVLATTQSDFSLPSFEPLHSFSSAVELQGLHIWLLARTESFKNPCIAQKPHHTTSAVGPHKSSRDDQICLIHP